MNKKNKPRIRFGMRAITLSPPKNFTGTFNVSRELMDLRGEYYSINEAKLIFSYLNSSEGYCGGGRGGCWL